MPNEVPKKLVEIIKNNKLIPFVGAGISVNVKDKDGNNLFLKWDELLLTAVSMLKDNGKDDEAGFIEYSLKVAKNSEDYLTIASKIKEYLATDWSNFLNKNFKKDHNKIDERTLNIPKEIWKLSDFIITTNYENVLRWSTDDKNLVIWDKKAIAGQVESLKNLPKEKTLWYLHGRIDNPDDIVLTSNSYEEVYKEDSGAIEVLKYHMLTKSFIFFGFSLDDIYLREQLKKIHTIFEGNGSPHFIVLRKGKEYDLSEFGDIRPLYVDDYDKDYLTLLKELVSYKNIEALEVDEVKQIQNKVEDDSKPIFNVPFRSKGNGAIGIEEKLQEVFDSLDDSSMTRIGQVKSFQGMGGLGKTQLAVEFAYKYRDNYSSVIWFTIDHDMDEQLIELAEQYEWVNKNIDAKEKIEIAKKRLFEIKDALIILDNVDTKDEIKEYYENLADNKILVTSRNPMHGFKIIPLDTLSEENSLRLLAFESNREIKDDELQYAKLIVDELGGLPLALEMAGSYVEYADFSWKDYYELYKRDGISFLEESDIESHTKHEINISKTLSLRESFLKQEPLIEKIIYLLAWGANEPLSKKLISVMLEKEEVELTKSISLGVKLKFIKESDDEYILHRLVRDVWRKKESLNNEFALNVSKNLADFMKEIKDEFLELKVLDKASLQAKVWAENVEDKYIKASLINYSVYPDYHKGNFEIAFESIENILELFKNEQESNIYAELLNNKAVLCRLLGNPRKSKDYFELALEMRKKISKGEDNAEMSLSLQNIGSILESLGELEESKDYYEQAFEMNKRIYKDIDHPAMASSLNSMGFILDSFKSFVDAKDYYEQALEMRKRIYGDINHPSILNSLHNMSNILEVLGNLDLANKMSDECVNMATKLYKNMDHPDTASALNNKAYVLTSLGYKKEAQNYYEQALEMRKRIYGDIDHPELMNTLQNYGNVLELSGEKKEAQNYYEQALEMSKRLYSINHQDTITCLFCYVNIIATHPLNKLKAVRILKEYQKEVKTNDKLFNQINNEIKRIEGPKIGRENSKRKKRRK